MKPVPFLTRSPFWIFALVIWFSTLFYLSSQTHLEPPIPDFLNRDKVLHATYFAMGGICLYFALAFRKRPPARYRICLVVILFCSLIGAFDEYRQSFIPNRMGNDPYDWAADTVGGILACLLAPRLISLVKRFAQR